MLVQPIVVAFTSGTEPVTASRHRRPNFFGLSCRLSRMSLGEPSRGLRAPECAMASRNEPFQDQQRPADGRRRRLRVRHFACGPGTSTGSSARSIPPRAPPPARKTAETVSWSRATPARSPRSPLARTPRQWRTEIRACSDTGGVPNGGTRAISGAGEETRQLAHAFRDFTDYGIRIPLVADGTRPYQHPPTRARPAERADPSRSAKSRQSTPGDYLKFRPADTGAHTGSRLSWNSARHRVGASHFALTSINCMKSINY